LRKLGVRFGAYHIYLPLLLKPAPRTLASLLWALQHGGLDNVKGLEEVPHLAASGRTSFAADQSIPKGFYRAAGFRVCGERVVRVDILERLADLIRPAIAYKPGVTPGEPPPGAADGDGFVVTVAMTSLTGCSGEAFSSILKSLGYAATQRPGPAITAPLAPAAGTEPIAAKPADAEAAPEEAASEESAVESPVAETVAEAQPAQAEEAIAETTAEPAPLAEATAGTEAATADESPAGEAAEIAQIEVWAPQRHAHAGPRRPPQQQRARRQGEAERGGPRRDRQPQAEGAGAPEAGPRHAAKPRFDKARFDKTRPGRGAPRDDERRPTRAGGGFAPAEKRERQPDPDSPFAKLAALKAELEKKGKG
jgi:ATP-dependent RNA helicase SUPV3L1/SUV3